VLEIFDVILRCACHRRADSSAAKRNRNRKSPPSTAGTGNASNHVMFRPVASESFDEDDEMHYSTNHRASSFNAPNTTSGRATLPRVKVSSTTFRGNGSRQTETDIWLKCESTIGLYHSFFTARRYAKRGTCIRYTTVLSRSVCLSVCHTRVLRWNGFKILPNGHVHLAGET